MILFEKDWVELYPYAIVDTETKNTSFIRYATLLKKMGVKNYLWPLQLHNRELQGVDPFDPNLTEEQMLLIVDECRNNFVYFIRECVRVPGSTHDLPIRFNANRGNMALYWLFMNYVTVLLIQIRQTGKSFSTDILSTWLMSLGTTNYNINLLTKDDTLRASNLDRLRKIEAELPFYLKTRKKGDIGNTEKMVWSRLKNTYEGHLPNKNPKMAEMVGRGLTGATFQIDEAAYFWNIAISLPAALAAGTAARDLARKRGLPFGTIITTTAGKKDDRDGAYVYRMLQESAIWTEMFFDARDREHLHSIIRKNSISDSGNEGGRGRLRVNCTFNHRQLGYTDEWWRDAVESSEAMGDEADRDFGNVWTAGNVRSPMSVQELTTIRQSERDIFLSDISKDDYIVRWFFDGTASELDFHMSKSHYILSLDTSDAAGGDDIGFTIRDIKDGAIVASGNFNETNLISFADWISSQIVRFPTLTTIIERRSSGATIIDYLLLILPTKGIDPFRRLYNTIVQNRLLEKAKFEEIEIQGRYLKEDLYVKYKKTFGFPTSSSGSTSRQNLYGKTLRNAVKLTGHLVRDKVLIEQLLSLEDNGTRIDHAVGSKDDLVISWLLSFWLMTQGENLDYYGINVRDILSKNRISREINSPENVLQDRRQEALRNEVERLVEELRGVRDEYKAFRLEHQLKLLSEELDDEDRRILSVSDLIASLRESRNKGRHRRR